MEKPVNLPYQCIDIAKNLLIIREEEFKKLLTEEISIKKAYPVPTVTDKTGDEIWAHLEGRKSGKKWLMRINMLHKSCDIKLIPHGLLDDSIGEENEKLRKDGEKKESGGLRETAGRKPKKRKLEGQVSGAGSV